MGKHKPRMGSMIQMMKILSLAEPDVRTHSRNVYKYPDRKHKNECMDFRISLAGICCVHARIRTRYL